MSASSHNILLDPSTAAHLDRFSRDELVGVTVESSAIASEQLAGTGEDRVDVQVVIRNLFAIIGHATVGRDTELFTQGIEAAVQIWDLGDRSAMYSTRTPDFEASLWEGLAIELYALGGLAVQHECWAELRTLTRQSPKSAGQDSWLRQGQVASARAADYDESILGLAAHRLQNFEPRLSDDESLAAVARFDLLSGLIISETDTTRFYPNAAEFGEALVEPLVIDQLRHKGSALRQHVFVDDDPGLRESLRDYDAKSRSQAALQRYSRKDWRWRAFADGRTWNFIDEGHILEQWDTPGRQPRDVGFR